MNVRTNLILYFSPKASVTEQDRNSALGQANATKCMEMVNLVIIFTICQYMALSKVS